MCFFFGPLLMLIVISYVVSVIFSAVNLLYCNIALTSLLEFEVENNSYKFFKFKVVAIRSVVRKKQVAKKKESRE